MTNSEALPYAPRSVPLARRWSARAAVTAAHLLATQPPARIRRILLLTARGARPATLDEAQRARDDVLAVSLAAGGQKGCLPRSLATVLLCRMRGTRVAWCVGVRTRPPFAAHAWVEAEGVLVGEDAEPAYFQRFMTTG
ncbi:lasso peptide biosynthesis B2 protein [Streptomyces qinglanensis]|uniref:lasso peptide biosynthesis B2 protein n=1 Tax=Streptomyces qinglanensis TaxID=943816 RepID=UPI003D72C0A6